MSVHDAFVLAVRGDPRLPAHLVGQTLDVQGVEEGVFDLSYLEFLDKQIELNARDEEWLNLMQQRKAGLSGWENRPLLTGRLVDGVDEYWIKVNPETLQVVYWEQRSGR